jgi:hypothetical protein
MQSKSLAILVNFRQLGGKPSIILKTREGAVTPQARWRDCRLAAKGRGIYPA